MRTNVLGSYVISDTELDVAEYNGEDDAAADADAVVETNPGTGANDMVSTAVALAVVSLVGAGALAFKKATR